MKIRICSDLHTEFIKFNKIEKTLNRILPIDTEDKDTILVCAGDIGTYRYYTSTYKPFFRIMSERFRKVIVVPGNHSWYSSSVWGIEASIWDDKKVPDNVHYLDNKSLVVDDVLFIGSALWTDFFRQDPFAMQYASRNMSDFELIKKSTPEIRADYGQIIATNRVLPFDTVIRHKESVAFIKSELEKHNDMKTVMVSHHAPTAMSVPERFKGASLNGAYYSNLEDIMLDNNQIKYWIHGHMHDSTSYEVGSTQVICNPFGYYYKMENMNFVGNLVKEI